MLDYDDFDPESAAAMAALDDGLCGDCGGADTHQPYCGADRNASDAADEVELFVREFTGTDGWAENYPHVVCYTWQREFLQFGPVFDTLLDELGERVMWLVTGGW